MLKPSRVPASKLGRLLHYGQLAASLGYGAATESVRRARLGPTDHQPQSNVFMSSDNMKRLVDKLSRMRGAALKLGQFLSIQGKPRGSPHPSHKLISRSPEPLPISDTQLLPPEMDQVLRQVQDSANYMPQQQTEVRAAALPLRRDHAELSARPDRVAQHARARVARQVFVV